VASWPGIGGTGSCGTGMAGAAPGPAARLDVDGALWSSGVRPPWLPFGSITYDSGTFSCGTFCWTTCSAVIIAAWAFWSISSSALSHQLGTQSSLFCLYSSYSGWIWSFAVRNASRMFASPDAVVSASCCAESITPMSSFNWPTNACADSFCSGGHAAVSESRACTRRAR
jgi:hypothetical protein